MTRTGNTTTIPGVLVAIHGDGILLQGDSGIGKSELALQLLDRGHQLVADDSVTVAVRNGVLSGHAPSSLAGMLEIRGLGPCPADVLFGHNAIRPSAAITLVVGLCRPKDWLDWPRLAPVRDAITLAGILVPRVRLPVAPERPLALVVEALARLHGSGHLQSETEHA
ncbi:hypothetical protein HC341_14580 [Aquisalimonas sp. 2447]|uniref:HPr kinase/phosphorylase n=1 Tax=Aquisalimonas sp. 2447 TaxID=2740807 RepID=UPI0014323D80|nr:hypothetical protein [Aquisalimonas sp. 2447]QIT56315.1 hypothetical protein HC341_14580 [Aquisalimonas sp. 2447]